MGGQNAANMWMFRIIPAFITGAFIVATYGLVAQICVRYYLQKKHRSGLVAGFIILYVVFFVLVMASYLRLFIAIQRDPGVVPLLNAYKPAIEEKQRAPGQIPSLNGSSGINGSNTRSSADDDASCTVPEACQPKARDSHAPWVPPDTNPDSPGLEAFYSKDVFVCEADGRPKWCSSCRQWKPDRSHHSRELGRCVRKMDHVCPWVGGMVAERCFNFFTQFTFYASAYCAVLVGICASTLVQQQAEEEEIDGWVIAVLAVSAFFLLFAGGMTLTSFRYVLINITNIDMMRRSYTYHLAVRIPRDAPPDSAYRTIVYPLPDGSQNSDDVPLRIAQRDMLAQRKFAILETKSRENPWDLGWKGNWKSIMGERVIDWFLPLRHSPCCDHEGRMDGDYPVGKLIDTLRERYGVPKLAEEEENVVIEKTAAQDVEMQRMHV